jgi:hypothetical protein
MNEPSSSLLPAMTPRSFFASLFAMMATAVLINAVHVLLDAQTPGEHALVIPALWVFLFLLALSALVRACFRFRLLSRPELLCVLYSMLLSGPLMTQGFWHRVVAITTTLPRTGDFSKMDAFSDKLWSADLNLLAEHGLEASAETLWTGGARLERMDHSLRRGDSVLVLENRDGVTESAVRFRLPLKDNGREGVMPGTPYLFSMLIRPSGFDGDTDYFARLVLPDGDVEDILRSRIVRPPSAIHPQGFQREGLYGYTVPPLRTEGDFFLEIGLLGAGRLDLADPQFRSVLALEELFTGRRTLSRLEYEALPAHQRDAWLPRPDSTWSLENLRYRIGGYVPWRVWWRPILAWGSLITLLLVSSLCVAVIMRRKWMDSERYGMPLTQIPQALLGAPDLREGEGMRTLLRNPTLWAGFLIGLVWCLLKIAAFYNPNVPNPGISVDLKPYFGPEWGEAWNTRFEVLALFLALAVFMELNILSSFVLGFFLFRLLHAYGQFSGMKAVPGFPFAQEQQIGGYLMYAVLVLFFSRKYLRDVLREALRPKAPDRGEIFSSRTALLTLAAAGAASLLWASWIGVSLGGMALFMGFLMVVIFVSMKLRAECGVAYGYFTPNNVALILLMAGGIGRFGPAAVLVSFMGSFFLTVTVFMLIPGAQLELIELGRRYGIRPRHILYTCLLGIAGGLVFGGYVFLSNSYALGANQIRHTWAFQEKPWYFGDFNRELAVASSDGAGRAPMGPAAYGYALGAGMMLVLTVLRQFFAGFWFHPLGFLMGSTHMMNQGWLPLWGNFLAAWVIRLLVVRFGGAEAVRKRLIPFFVGVFLAAVLATLLANVHGAILRSQGVESIFSNLL